MLGSTTHRVSVTLILFLVVCLVAFLPVSPAEGKSHIPQVVGPVAGR